MPSKRFLLGTCSALPMAPLKAFKLPATEQKLNRKARRKPGYVPVYVVRNEGVK